MLKSKNVKRAVLSFDLKKKTGIWQRSQHHLLGVYQKSPLSLKRLIVQIVGVKTLWVFTNSRLKEKQNEKNKVFI